MARDRTEEARRLLDEANEALEADAAEEALDLVGRGESLAGAGDPELRADLRLARAAALNQLGRSEEALEAADAILAENPDDLDAMLERAFALWERMRLDEAAAQLREVVRRAPDEAWAHHTLGLVAERRGDRREAERRFRRARRLDPDDFPDPPRLAPEAFDAAVEEALAALPGQVSRWLENVAIAVEDIPADDDLLGSDPPLSPAILGIFRGSPLAEKRSMDPWSHFPSSIVLYQRNLERFARNREELVEQIGVTLLHEVGHFLGLDEEALRERGLD
jgi:predicted Zn-dependent protease with MMP-like domain